MCDKISKRLSRFASSEYGGCFVWMSYEPTGFAGTLYLKLSLIILKAFQTVAISTSLIIYCFRVLIKGSISKTPLVVSMLPHAAE
jgi:hypothetical protein